MRRPISSLTVPVLLLIALQAPPARAQRPPAINGSAPLAAHAAGEARDTALDADALLRRCMEAERRARSLTADYRRETRSAGQLSVLSGTLQLTKPNLALIRVRGAVPSDTLVYRSDALNFVTYRPAESDYFSQPSDDSGRHIQSTGCVEAAAFFDPSVIRTYRGQAARVTIGAPLTIDGARCTRVVLEGAPGRSTFQLYIGADQLLRGMRSVIGPQLSIESRISRVRSPAAIPSAVFAWKPPPGTRPSAGSTCRFAISDRLRDPALTAPGRNAPDFPVTCAGPGIRGLFGLLRQRKAIVLDFWGFGCAACMESLPRLDRLRPELELQDADVIAVCINGEANKAAALAKARHLRLPLEAPGSRIAALYGIDRVPTTLVIDKSGRIVARWVGGGDDKLRRALKSAGIALPASAP